MEFISIKTALSDFFRNTGRKDEINEDSLLQWAADCMSKIGHFRQYKSNIVLLDIENYKAKLPNDFILVEHLLYNGSNKSCEDLTLELSETITPALEEDCQVTVHKTCMGCCNTPIIETIASDDLIKSHPWIGYSRVVLNSEQFKRRFRDEFIPMFLSDKAAIKYHIPDCTNVNIVADGVLYTIKDGYIISNQKSGRVLMFYLGQSIDDEGYPMIPDAIEYIEAIYYYIEMKLAWSDYTGDKSQGSRLLFRDVQQMSNDAIARCIAKMNMPTWAEAIEISEMWRQRIPPVNLRGNNLNYNIERNKFVNNAGYRSTSTLFRTK